MRLGLGLGLSNYRKRGGSTPGYAPTAKPASSVNANDFDANATVGSRNVALFLTVANDSGFTSILSAYNNLNIGLAVPYNVSTGISGLHTYYYRFRAALNVANPPVLPASFNNTQTVVYVDGNSDEIINAYNAISDASVANTYKLIVPAHTYNIITGYAFNKDCIYLVCNTGTVLNLTVDGSIQMGGRYGSLTNCTVNATNTAQVAIHSDNSGAAGTCILSDLNVNCYGTSQFACAGGIYENQKISISNCNFYTELASGAFLFHDKVDGGAGSAQLFLVNCTITVGVGSTHKETSWENKGGTSTTNFFYISGGNIGNFEESNAGGAGETSIYITSSTVVASKVFSDPDSELDSAEFATLLTDNLLSFSDYSNVVSVETDSEGNRPLDNVTIGSLVTAHSANYQLRTNYAGSIINTQTNLAAVTTLFDQSGNGLDAAESDALLQPIYNTNSFGTGRGGVKSVSGASPSQLQLPSVANLGTSYDIVIVVKITDKICMVSGNNSPGIMYLSSNGNTYHFVTGQNIVFTPTITGAPMIFNIRRRGTSSVDLYINGVYFDTQVLANNNAKTWEFLLNDNAGDNTIGLYADGATFTNPVTAEVDGYVSAIKTLYGIS